MALYILHYFTPVTVKYTYRLQPISSFEHVRVLQSYCNLGLGGCHGYNVQN